MNREEAFKYYREQAALVPGQVTGLFEAGMQPDVLAESFGVSEASVKSWSNGAVPTDKSFEELQEVVSAMEVLERAGLEPDEAASWLQTPFSLKGDGSVEVVPLDLLTHNPKAASKLLQLIFGDLQK